MTDYYCATCDAGPWSENAVGSNGILIVKSHRDLNHNVIEYKEPEKSLEQQFTDRLQEEDPLSAENIQNLKEGIRNEPREFRITKKNKKYVLTMMDKAIQTLRPISLLDDTKRILVYYPTRTHEIIENEKKGSTLGDVEFESRAYFVSCRNNTKDILPVDDSSLKENFKIKVLDSGYETRWSIGDLNDWLHDKTKMDPKELYDLHYSTVRKYIEFSQEEFYIYFTLWNIGTYFYELFDAYPYNDFTGTKRAGKSKALEFQSLVCYNALKSADMSGSSTFRSIEGLGATLLLDETENFSNKKNEQAQHLRILLLQGFLKDQHVIRSEAQSSGGYVPTSFNLYGPKSLGHISELDNVLEDRCIQLVMRRTKNSSLLKFWPSKRDSCFARIRNLSYRLFLDYADEIKQLEQEAAEKLPVSGREMQLWLPIMTLAVFFENHGCQELVSDIQKMASNSSSERQLQDEQDTRELRILRFLDDVISKITEQDSHIKGNPIGWIPITEIFTRLQQEAERFEIKMDSYTRNHLSNDLKRLGFKQERKSGGYSWYITRDEITECKSRFGLLESKQTLL